MRLTVGPLPPAVYWRRRAAVLGGLLLVIVVLMYSCTGSGGEGASATHTPSPVTPVELTPTAGPEPTLPPVTAGPTTPPASAPVIPVGAACTDAEIQLIPVPARTTAPRGATIVIRLRIKNISTRTCSRDVGADLQELRVVRGAQTVWSSDVCGAASGRNVRSFPPNHEQEYQATWNGRSSSTCAGSVPGGPVPVAGQYQVLGRLGTKLSDPVQLTLT